MYRKPFATGLACLMTFFVITSIAHAQTKITGPWLWMIAPNEADRGGVPATDIDSLDIASAGSVTEADVAANGAKEGATVGNYVWTFSEISPDTGDINAVINQIGMAADDLDDYTSYALIQLESARPQRGVTMRVGSDDSIKVWLNGEVVHRNAVNRPSFGFQDEFQVDLVEGNNLLMVKVSDRRGAWRMFVGIDRGRGGDDRMVPDANLRAAIENALAKAAGAPITTDEMATLTELEAPKASIHNLTGLENATNLTSLDLRSNNISDPSALAGLTKLTSLNLGSNRFLSDLSSLAGLTNLTELYLGRSHISDLSSLAGLTNLTRLGLSNNSLSDISSLSGLTNLTYLNLWDNSISDISSLSGLTNLTRLDLQYNNISDISALAGLTKLTWLDLTNNSISDISSLSGLTKLPTLRLQYNNITDLSPLAGLVKLTTLSLQYNSISDISPLAGLTKLPTLRLQYNNITDLSPLAGLVKLTRLDLTGNNISDISALAELVKLTWLGLTGNSISDISPLTGLVKLTRLDLTANNISDISPLVANRGLRSGDTVDVQRNPLNSVSIKTHIPTLQSRGVTVEFEDRTHLNVGEPHTVRLIYFLPSDRQSKPDIDTQMDTLIKRVQQSYADDMERYGFGRKTFEIETDVTGKAVVHHVDGQFTAEYYEEGTSRKVRGEIEAQFDIQRNIYLVVVDSGYLINGSAGVASGSLAIINNILDLAGYVYLASHELRHTFGLIHDFRIDSRGFTFEISKCTAEFLDVHRYFNASRQDQNVSRGTIKVLPPSLASPPNAIHFRFEVTDADGLHQAQLLTHEVRLPGGRTGGFLACKRLTGTSSTVEFVTTALIPKNRRINLRIIDVHGNITARSFPIDVASLLPPPEVVSILDDSLAWEVRGTLRLSPGDALTTHTMLNLTRFKSFDHQITDPTGLEHAHNLKWLSLSGNSNEVSNLSPLEGLTQLRWLYLNGNNVSDLSALAGLTNLTVLELGGNKVADVSPLVGLTNLARLDLRGNPLGYASIYIHIPAIQAKGIEVMFDNRPHPALLKISGDNQKGAAFASLFQPFVVEAQDANGSPLAGIAVTFAVTAGGGTLSTQSTMTDANGRAQTTLTLGPNLETNTVSVSAAGIESSVIFHAIADTFPTEYLLSIPVGISLIHVPLKVTAVDGVEKTIISVADLYDALGGADTVNLLGTHDSKIRRWFSYTGTPDRGTSGDQPLTDDKGIIASMKAPVAIRLRGDALGANGSSAITLYPGINIVGVPLRDSRIARVSDLFALDGIRDNVIAITVSDSGEFHTVRQVGDPGDIPITGGQSFNLKAQEAATVAISGDGWYNASGTAAAPLLSLTGIQVTDTTPVLALRGSIASPVGGRGRMSHLPTGSGFRVIAKNLSTGRAVSTEPRSAFRTVTGGERAGYQLTVVDIETGWAAQIGDKLEISVRSPDPLIGVQPLQYTVTAEDVKQGLIQLTELVAYEIPTETELLRNYPNPFNPETWIPYRLAEDAFVTLTIYDLSGRVVRTLDVGHQIAAVYESRSKAVYWDGRNDVGEGVASGVYFYHLSAGDYSATRKMVILK